MCGIVYAHNFDGKPVNNDVLNIFDAQRHRGVQGFGLFDGQENHMVHATKEEKILKWLVKYDSNLILFHHRYPTSTVNVKKAAHPFSTRDFFGDTQYILVHNGHISNSKELRLKHKELGIDYYSKLDDKTFNDSEALAWDLALTLEGKQEKLEARGGIAFVCLKLVKGQLEKMYFGRNSNPLKLFRDDHGISLSSEGKGEMIDDDVLFTYHYKMNRLFRKPFEIQRYTYTPPARPPVNEYSEYSGRDWRYRDTDDVHNADVVQRVASWLPRHIRQKYGKFLSPPLGDDAVIDYDRHGNPIYESDQTYDSFDHYVQSKNGLYLPAGAVSTTVDRDEVMEELEGYQPMQGEIQSLVLQYLIGQEGHFESAYWAMEGDYELLEDIVAEDHEDAVELAKNCILQEKALSMLMDDEEYIDDKSVSSMWEAICNQPKSQQTLPLPVH